MRQHSHNRAAGERTRNSIVLWSVALVFWAVVGEGTAQTSTPAAPAIQSEGEAAGTPAATVPEGEAPKEDRPADLYINRCSGCHTLGSGMLSGPGPDLLPATRWPEAELSRKIKSMEKNAGPISDEEVQQLTVLMKDPQVSPRLEAARARAEKMLLATLEPGSAVLGERLFTGRQAFRNGGLHCAACHAVAGSGGTLGFDLTGVFQKMGQAGLVSACEQTNFNVMRAIYRTRPVTKQEALHLAKFFETQGGAAGDSGLSRVQLAAICGMAGAVVFMGILGALLRRRNPGTRKRLLHSATRR